jgi:hypothetical protein
VSTLGVKARIGTPEPDLGAALKELEVMLDSSVLPGLQT